MNFYFQKVIAVENGTQTGTHHQEALLLCMSLPNGNRLSLGSYPYKAPSVFH